MGSNFAGSIMNYGSGSAPTASPAPMPGGAGLDTDPTVSSVPPTQVPSLAEDAFSTRPAPSNGSPHPSETVVDCPVTQEFPFSSEESARPAAARDSPRDGAAFAARYEARERLGEGGMGEVHLFADRWIGRDVAMKVMRPLHFARPDLRGRFLREVRVQGQLEHPSIVPVYDLGRSPTGASYFTMKRIKGVTFADVIERRRTGDEKALREYSRYRLLSAFESVCQAIHYAHTRGVLHRDLKPTNIMLGDFGEVYVLDWGLAKLVGSPDPVTLPSAETNPGGTRLTAYGAIMGTAGYMAPEQVHSDMSHAVGPWTDVYALGVILFELLSTVTLHKGRSVVELLQSTLAGVDVHAEVLASRSEIPCELVDLCAKATSLEPESRFSTVGEMREAIVRYLEGDRDLERRRALAGELTKDAEGMLLRVLEPDSDGATRTLALTTIGRALALDPDNVDAREVIVRLMMEPPSVLPADAHEELATISRHGQRLNAQLGTGAYLILAALNGGLAIATHATNACASHAAQVLAALWVCASVSSFGVARMRVIRGGLPYATMVIANLAIAGSATIFGPYVLVPVLATVNTFLGAAFGGASPRRIVALGLGIMAIVAPAAAVTLGRASTGVTPFLGQVGMEQTRGLGGLSPIASAVFLVGIHLAVLLSAVGIVTTFREKLTKLELRFFLQAWQLRQLVPSSAHGVMRTRSSLVDLTYPLP